jgi:hypothetical protein
MCAATTNRVLQVQDIKKKIDGVQQAAEGIAAAAEGNVGAAVTSLQNVATVLGGCKRPGPGCCDITQEHRCHVTCCLVCQVEKQCRPGCAGGWAWCLQKRS